MCPEPASAARPEPSAPAPPPPTLPAGTTPPSKMVHAVFDAGSSGLRLQIFEVTRREDGSCAAAGKPFSKKADTNDHGLADMTERTAEDKKERMSFKTAEGFLSGLWDPLTQEQKESVTGVALLGTGGFRDVTRIAKGARIMMRELDRIVAGWKQALGKPGGQDWEAVTIEGEEEGTLAWLAARELNAKVTHVTIETGGQTCQYAVSDVAGWSDELGSNAVKKLMESDTTLAPCRLPPSPPAASPPGAKKVEPDADRCIAAFGKYFNTSKMISEGVKAHPILEGTEVWAMGGAWAGLFVDYTRTTHVPSADLWTGEDPKIGASMSLRELYDFAKQVCSKKPPPYPLARREDGTMEKPYEPEYRCMRAAHAVAFAVSVHGGDVTKGVQKAIAKVGARRLIDGVESFTRGAAVSGSVFGECAAQR